METLAAQKISELGDLPRFLRQVFQETGASFRKIRSADGAFSLTEQICHLRDLEQQGYLVRIQRILQEDRPDLAEFDGEKVAKESDYLSQDPAAALDAFEQTRNASITLLAQLTEDQLLRRGRFGTFGMITMNQLMDMMLEHDRSHKAELEALREEWQSKPKASSLQ